MKIKIIFILIGSILFIQSCATSTTMPTTELAAVASREQKTGYDGTIISRKKHVVSLSPYAELASGVSYFDLSKYKTLFMLFVENGGKEPINIGFDNIAMIFEANSKDPAPMNISIQSFDDFMADFEMLYNENEKVFIYDTVYEFYKLRIVDEKKLYDFRKDLMTGRIIKDAIQRILPEYTLEQKTIIEPGNSYSGIVICDTHDLDPQPEGRFLIIVSVDGEEHYFTFNRSITDYTEMGDRTSKYQPRNKKDQPQ